MAPFPEAEAFTIERCTYGGDGLAPALSGVPALMPYTLPGELVRLTPHLEVLQPSADRTSPACEHFGICGGCQYQMATYPAQLELKKVILLDLLDEAGQKNRPELKVHSSPEPYGYRNRIRLRVRTLDGTLQFGYSQRNSNAFLPIRMCPIAAPLLWRAAATLRTFAETTPSFAGWLQSVAELELFTDTEQSKLQITLLFLKDPKQTAATFLKAMDSLQAEVPELSAAAAVRIEPRTLRHLQTLASWGATGLPYAVAGETYWITRGAFFQVNRFLIETLVDLVAGTRSGTLAWDLFAGVGLFSRVLARHFGSVTAVEANPTAAHDLQSAFRRLGPRQRAVQSTTLDFLRRAVVERDRPDLIVLDPPRAGAGEETCQLLARLAPAQVVYLSCDPTTLARDLAVLTPLGYTLTDLHLIDLFPQTFHLETLAVLQRCSLQ